MEAALHVPSADSGGRRVTSKLVLTWQNAREGEDEGGRCTAAWAGMLPEPKASLRATSGVCGHATKGDQGEGGEA